MKIGIIGAGFTGLAAGYLLSKKGYNVTIFESGNKAGGLAVGYKETNWKWSLEAHYHHWFISDWPIRNLAKEIGHKINFTKAKTSTFYNGKIYQLDSPISLLLFDQIPLFDRIRTGVFIAYLRVIPFWKNLTKISAYNFINKYTGKKSWEVLWRPLFEEKFGKYEKEIPASWFWARIKKRSVELGYPEGGYQSYIDALVFAIKKNKGKIIFNEQVNSIQKNKDKIIVKTKNKNNNFDRVLSTLPTKVFSDVTKGLTNSYKKSLTSVEWIGAVSTILILKNRFFNDRTYWLNVNDSSFPFLALVEHTNLINKRNYGNENILYIANYKDISDKLFVLSNNEILVKYLPYLKKINPKFDNGWIESMKVFKSAYAQPILPVNYLGDIPDFKTPISGLYLANMQQIYPWDRGTNFSIEQGLNVAKLIIKTITKI